MARHLRYQSHTWATHHVVSRCLQGFSFLTPHPKVVAVCSGALTYALHQHQGRITLQHYAFLSNHFHLIISSRQRADLSSFMRLLKSQLTRELNRVYDWKGTLWEGRYGSEELLDEASLIKLLKYVTQNSVKEGLVDHPREWTGLHGYHQIVERKPLRGAYVDRTALCFDDRLTEADVTTYYEAQLSPPPMWEAEGTEAYYERCVVIFEEAILEAQQAREGQAMGIAQVLQQPVLRQRLSSKGGYPFCRAQCPELLKAFKERYARFKQAFQEVSSEVRSAIKLGLPLPALCFPEGGVPLFGMGAELPS